MTDEFGTIIANHLAGLTGDFVPALEAHKLYVDTDPEVVDAWLHAHAVDFIRQELTALTRRHRGRERHAAKRRAFGHAVAAAEGGDLEPLRHFEVVHVVDNENTRRRVADMTGPDFLFVAKAYEAVGREHLMEAAFRRAVAKRIGPKRCADVMTVETYDELYQSIIKRPKSPA